MSCLFACLISSLLAAPGPDRGVAERGQIIARELDIYDEPAGTGYVTGQLRQGETVYVHGVEPDGWLAIEPPEGTFLWVRESDLDLEGEHGGRAVVATRQATSRAGREGARLPGPPSLVLPEGTELTLADVPPLTLKQGRNAYVWRAVEPPAGVLRYVRADGVKWRGAGRSRPVSRPTPARIDPNLASLASIGPQAASRNLPADVEAALRRVEDDHRAELRQPLVTWRLGRVDAGYRDLLGRTNDPAVRGLLEARLAQVARQNAAAEAARRVEKLLEAPRRDPDPTSAETKSRRRASSRESAPEPESYDREGLLQRSSRQVDGQRVYALIARDGSTACYVRGRPGIRFEPLLGRRVGIRGAQHFDSTLRSEVIDLEVIEPLGPALP